MSRRSSGSSRRRCVAFMSVVLVAKEILFLTIMLGFRPTRQPAAEAEEEENPTKKDVELFLLVLPLNLLLLKEISLRG